MRRSSIRASVRSSLIALLAAFLVAGAVMAAPTSPSPASSRLDALLVRLDKSAQSVQTLAGQFTQKSRLKLFKQELASRGRFFFRRPRQVRWEYTEPDASTLVLDAEKATLKTPGAPPQTFDLGSDATLRAVFDQLFLWLGAGSLEKARADYELVAGGTDTAPTLTLTPRPTSPVAKAFARIELRFDERALLHAILLREPNGDDKEIVFDKLTRDGKLPADAFSP